jgi:MscS family membrane protein
LDKPFVIGDLIRVGNVEGNVEKIGFRSTRIRTLEKTFVTVPNKKLVDTELDNLTNREIRRIKFDIGLRHDTPASTTKSITEDIRLLIENDPMRFDEVSVYFYELSNAALIIRVIYFANTAVWKDYMVMREKINYSIIEVLEKHEAQLAFPIQRVIMEKNIENNEVEK